MASRFLAVAVTALLAACAGDPPTVQTPPTEVVASPSVQPEAAGGTEPPAAPTVAAVVCGTVEKLPEQGGSHLVGDQEPPVPYNSTPPTSGWHSSGAFEIEVRPPDDPLTEPQQVSVLEAGGVVVSYDGISRAERRTLTQLVRDEYDGRVAVTRYPDLRDGEVALTAWQTLQRCDGLDVDAVRAFADAHVAEDVVEPGH